MKKPSNKIIITSIAAPKISFYILIVDTIVKGSDDVKRVFEVVDEVTHSALQMRSMRYQWAHEQRIIRG